MACSKIFPSFDNSSFRDRRYEYKGLNKTWKGKLAEAKSSGNSMKIQEAQVQLCTIHHKTLFMFQASYLFSFSHLSFAGHGCSI